MTDAGNDPMESYRRADQRLRLLLLGDGVATAGNVKGEEQRQQVIAELRRMRTALDAVLEREESRAKDAGSGAVSLEEELQSIASLRSSTYNLRTDSVPRLVTPAEAAEALRMSVSSIHRAVRNGEIRAVRLTEKRGGLRIPSSEVQRLFDARLLRR
jgi:excisionase family DNA binding protein